MSMMSGGFDRPLRLGEREREIREERKEEREGERNPTTGPHQPRPAFVDDRQLRRSQRSQTGSPSTPTQASPPNHGRPSDTPLAAQLRDGRQIGPKPPQRGPRPTARQRRPELHAAEPVLGPPHSTELPKPYYRRHTKQHFTTTTRSKPEHASSHGRR